MRASTRAAAVLSVGAFGHTFEGLAGLRHGSESDNVGEQDGHLLVHAR